MLVYDWRREYGRKRKGLKFDDMRIKVNISFDGPILCGNAHIAASVCKQRKWKILASDSNLWFNLFEERWGIDRATFYAPIDSKSWKEVYAVQDRCDQIGLGLKIIREGDEYYLVHQGEIQRYLGSRRQLEGGNGSSSGKDLTKPLEEEEPCMGILDRILCFIGDLEAASVCAMRSRVL